MIWECLCGQSKTERYFFVKKGYRCHVCNGLLVPKEQVSLSFFLKHESFKDLSEDFLVGKRRSILQAIKDIQPCSDRDISLYLNLPINQVTGRRFELANCGIPFIVSFGDKIDVDTKKRVTLWKVNSNLEKCFDVEREIEVKQCLN